MEAKDLKATELRIGNLAFEKDNGVITIDGAMIKWLEEGSYRGIEPIELTEEWLEKLGFQNIDDEIDFSEWQNEWVLIYGNGSDKQEPFRFNYSLNEKGEDIFIELLFVHQLQNLFYCLCGQELTLIK